MDQQKARKEAFTSQRVDQKRRTYPSCIWRVKLLSLSWISRIWNDVVVIKHAYARTWNRSSHSNLLRKRHRTERRAHVRMVVTAAKVYRSHFVN